jgi:hypothetical protein
MLKDLIEKQKKNYEAQFKIKKNNKKNNKNHS